MKRFVASAAGVLVLDQASKLLARGFLEPGRIVPLLGDLLRFRYVHNAGAAFGFFQGNRFLFIGISLVSIAVILYLILAKRYAFRGSRVAFGMVFGGALGNLVDRLWIAEVIDFIDVGIGAHRWPTFNIADAGVTLGVLYLIFSVLLLERRGAPRGAIPGEQAASPGHETPREPRGDDPDLGRGDA